MQHVVNEAHTRWVAANLTSGHLVHAGTTDIALQGTTRAGAGLRKQRMCKCLER